VRCRVVKRDGHPVGLDLAQMRQSTAELTQAAP
jgi:hypothetical protein